MSTFKIQRIRYCVQCKETLPLKCLNCVKHPNRRPRVIERHDWPEIIKTAECSCCIKIRCEALGCVQTMWRHTGHVKGGKSMNKRFFCSKICFHRSIRNAQRVTVPCAYCRKLVEKKVSRTWTHSFCHQTCYVLYRAKTAHQAREAKKKDNNLGLLWCHSCRAINEHNTPRHGLARCMKCGAQRGQVERAMESREISQIASLGRK